MAELIRGLDAARVAARLEEVRAAIAAAGRDPDEVAILAAVKYVAVEELGVLAEAGVSLVGENRAQALAEKRAAWPDAPFTWDFIGHLQSRKVKDVLPLVRLVHSAGSDSVLDQLDRRAPEGTEVLVEVNVARDPEKSGFAPDDLPRVLERAAAGPWAVRGLMTMPPLAAEPEASRRWFAALAQLAADHGLPELSMGTTQDFAVAAAEGATIVRVGSLLFR